VEGKVLLQSADLLIALLRFGPQSTIDEHPAPYPIDVICLEGAGRFSVDGAAAPLHAGERVQWPADRPHRLWTEAGSMLTLMVEHPGARSGL
jgi:quercetin dioxygenase-like cupin family protein